MTSLGIEGDVMRTDMGELLSKQRLLLTFSKALSPFQRNSTVSDVETIHRKRYLDLISNQKALSFVTRLKIILSEIRRHLDGQGFLKLKHLFQPTNRRGAAARPFHITHHNVLKNIYYGATTVTELHLKRVSSSAGKGTRL